MIKSEDKNEHESGANDPQIFASLVSKKVSTRLLVKPLTLPLQWTKIVDKLNEDDDDYHIDTAQKKVFITSENQLAIMFSFFSLL
jgi:hypothetical protein